MAELDDLMAVLRPRRSLADVMAGVIRVELGGQPYVLPVRSIAENEEWQASLATQTIAILNGIEKLDDPAEILRLLASVDLLDLLVSYDKDGALPPKTELRRIARPHEALRSVMEVWQAANPLVDLAAFVLNLTSADGTSPVPTSTPSQPGGSTTDTSGPHGPTSSSSATSTPPTSANPTSSNGASKRSAPGTSSRGTGRRTTHGSGRPRGATGRRSGSPAQPSSVH